MTVHEIIQEELRESLNIYERRRKGEAGLWSATTRCKICGATWLWGVEDNLEFTCLDCTIPDIDRHEREDDIYKTKLSEAREGDYEKIVVDN